MLPSKKVLIISTNADEAGAPRHVEIIVNTLLNDFNFKIVFGEHGPVSDRLLHLGIPVTVVPELRSKISLVNDSIAIFKISKIVKSFNPSIIHCHSTKAGLIGRVVSIFHRKRVLYTVHGWGWRGLNFLSGLIIVTIEAVFPRITNSYNLYVSNDTALSAKKHLHLNDNHGTVLYNGVPDLLSSNINSIPFSSERKDEISITILMAARVSSAKDYFTLFSAFDRLPKNFKLVVCGAGTESQNFKNFAASICKLKFLDISFIGQTNSIIHLMKTCDIFSLISNFEALPLSIIEAMSCSLPVIATNVGGVSELVIHNETGLLVEKNDIVSLESSFLRLIDSNLRFRYGKSARIRYEEKFRVDIMTSEISKLYNA